MEYDPELAELLVALNRATIGEIPDIVIKAYQAGQQSRAQRIHYHGDNIKRVREIINELYGKGGEFTTPSIVLEFRRRFPAFFTDRRQVFNAIKNLFLKKYIVRVSVGRYVVARKRRGPA